MANENFVALGKIAMKPKGAWSNKGIEYKELDIVTFNNASYIATAENKSKDDNRPGATGAPWMLLNDNNNVVLFNEPQSLTDAQKTQARSNIGAGKASDITSLTTNIATIEENIATIEENSAYNILNNLPPAASGTVQEVTFTNNNDGSWTVTTSSNTVALTRAKTLYGSQTSLPAGFEIGKTYYIKYTGEKVGLSLTEYKQDGTSVITVIYKNEEYTIGPNVKGLEIKLRVASGMEIDEETVHPMIFNALTNTELSTSINSLRIAAIEPYGALFPDTFWKKLTLINGNSNDKGVVDKTKTHRIVSESILTFEHAVEITFTNSTYRIFCQTFNDNGEYITNGDISWTTSVILQPNIHYRLLFRTQPETNTSEKLDINNFMNDVKFNVSSIITPFTTAFSPAPSKILSIGHGGTKVWPPNTLGLYKQYYKNNIMNWECDIMVTNMTEGATKHDYVLCHDDNIYIHARDANGNELPYEGDNIIKISKKTLADLRQYNFGCLAGSYSTNPPTPPSEIISGFEDEKIPTLQEFLLLAKAAGATVFIEPKFSLNDTKYTGQVTNIVNIIKKYGMLDNAYIIAYAVANKVIEEAAGAGAQNFCIIINNGEASEGAIETAADYLEGKTVKNVFFNPSSGNLISAIDNNNIDIIGTAANYGMKVSTWTIQENTSTADIIKLYEAGCTAFITNKDNIEKIIRKSYGLTLD